MSGSSGLTAPHICLEQWFSRRENVILQCLETFLVTTTVGIFGYLVCACEYLEARDVAKYPTMHRRDPTPHALIFDRFSMEIDYLLRNVDQWLLSSTQVTHFNLIGRSTVWGRRPGAFREKSPQRLSLLTVSILRL